jgi:hypothetical protein
MCAATPAYNPGHVKRIILTQNGGCVGAPLVISFANIFDVLPAGVAAGAVLQFTAHDLNQFYESVW